LIPLIEETALRIQTIPPAKSQTGPAVRQDQPTIDQHLALLDKYPQLKKIYAVMTESIASLRSQ
jgi:hypothetical protein